MATHNVLNEYIGGSTSLALAKLVEHGLPTESLALLREKGLTFTEMSAIISPRTLKHRKARGENLSSEETDRAIRVSSIVALAESVFGNPVKAMGWLRYPNTRLEDRTPLSMLHTEAGGRLVEGILYSISEGIYS
ncbi:putative toxin-antitoxin system antitoxin component, TIGR02293 family [Granulicella pectinivorans]|uniref:Putative toxin-antitoxin system antitoxin component, TIGR02293 family n=1 Tax=Granulicella pectinivorans TaxID=474950 RepID=A0A1I6LPI3_9BACT|nr:antitoxin Xre/MbcA/ParS toxin-binding domain-containing protein [Granulicella pectinivorans]SFS05404.1 putative toxin-antitoxin system antitoxin component, TIGR02293 family [Granulicella pectinivorans]